MKFDRTQSKIVQFSIIAGRVSTEDSDRILQTLRALFSQRADPPTADRSFEVILADRRKDEISRQIAKEFPEVKLVPCDSWTDLPTMRMLALKQSAGKFIAVTEDHCVPESNWIETLGNIVKADSTADVIGGCVINGVDETALDWATFLCEYSGFVPPVQEKGNTNLPGMNVVYRRSLFDEIPESVLTDGFWETTLHGLLIDSGKRFVSVNQLRMYHCKKFSLKLFLMQRFLYSRYYAGRRFAKNAVAKRVIAAVACTVLPPLLLFRFLRNAQQRSQLSRHLFKALPYLLLFYLVWAAGEAVGYLFGPADSLARIE